MSEDPLTPRPRTTREELIGTPSERQAKARRRLRIVRVISLLDLLLLAVLLTASFSGNRDLVSALGPVHGGNFVLLLVLVGTAASDGLWSWWFPAGILVTGGPVGALIGERIVSRRLATA